MNHQNADEQQRNGADGDVSESFPDRLAIRCAPTERQGNGHPHDEKERGENQIHERHSTAVAMTVAKMNHPVGHDLASAGEVVHENHHKHHKSAQRVNGRDARGMWEGSLQSGNRRLYLAHRFLVIRSKPLQHGVPVWENFALGHGLAAIPLLPAEIDDGKKVFLLALDIPDVRILAYGADIQLLAV